MSLGGRGYILPIASYKNQSGQPLYALLMTTQRYLKTNMDGEQYTRPLTYKITSINNT